MERNHGIGDGVKTYPKSYFATVLP
jgi:hypothetical protein